ncbi:alpha/beta hydrolase [Nocardioides aequoreus]|uniref:alpha/beta hydrolase n=1 Tax=Nocardioides aequoreus TaxID=397278 RepID=UPI0004C3302C|nr:alpha/beta hydrolase [Nocardioides aequoreus]
MTTRSLWRPDVLGEGYQQRVLELGPDPDGEGDVRAVLVRRDVRADETVRGAVLYVHGFTDYFFQTEMADFFAEHGLAFHALDLRKCGRARREGQTPHYVSDLALCDEELELALAEVEATHPGLPVVVVAHSTGGLMTALWLDRRRARGEVAPVVGLVHNSPWYDLQGSAVMRGPVTQALRVASRARPFRQLKAPLGHYGRTLHVEGTGEWEFDTTFKPLDGFGVTVGWLNAVRRGHARLHRGLDVGVPALVLRSDKTHYAADYSERSDVADIVLDVRQIQRWSGCLGQETLVVPIADARHDVYLSLKQPRDTAYAVTEKWLREHV